MRTTTTILTVTPAAVEDAAIDLSRPGMAWIEFRSGVCLSGELDDDGQPVSLAMTLWRLACLTAEVEGADAVAAVLAAHDSWVPVRDEERVPA